MLNKNIVIQNITLLFSTGANIIRMKNNKIELLPFIENCLNGTLFKYEHKKTKYTDKGYYRFINTYDGCAIYISKNRIILIHNGFTFSADNKYITNYKSMDKDDFTKEMQNLYNRYRFFTSHYPQIGANYSLKTGNAITQ